MTALISIIKAALIRPAGSPIPPYEDLRTYTEADPSSKIEISADGLRVTYTQVNDAYMGWLRKAQTFSGDYSIDFEVRCTGKNADGGLGTSVNFHCLSILNNAKPEASTYGGAAILRGTSTQILLGVAQRAYCPQHPEVTQVINQDQTYYCTLERVAGTLKLYIYTDSGRTVLLATLTSPTLLNTDGTQIFACAGDLGTAYPGNWISGYTQNILIG
jgi:hypothetical protein